MPQTRTEKQVQIQHTRLISLGFYNIYVVYLSLKIEKDKETAFIDFTLRLSQPLYTCSYTRHTPEGECSLSFEQMPIFPAYLCLKRRFVGWRKRGLSFSLESFLSFSSYVLFVLGSQDLCVLRS